MKCTVNVFTQSIAFTFDNGKKLELSISDIHETDKPLVEMYGLRQKLQDAAASAQKVGVENGKDTETTRYEMIESMIERLKSGTGFARVSDGVGRISYLIQAVGNLYNLTADVAGVKVKSLTDEKQKALAASPKIAAEIANLKAKAAALAAIKAAEGISEEEEELPEL